MGIRKNGAGRLPLLLGAAYAALASQPLPAQSVEALAQLSIEELAQVEVRSASKQAEPLSEAPTAIFVINEEDILRSAATSLPDLLRQAPNLQVQQLNARQYAISARGFNGFESSNKLLVLIDGRSVYTPLHSGVFWELHAPLIEDLEQIEVISGPGGTLFGPNAVNGVINVASKDARQTIGGLARGTIGGDERTLALRYGMALGASGAVRVYGNAFHREDQPQGDLAATNDRHKGWQAGFRTDWESADDRFTVQGDVFETDLEQLPKDGDRGHNLLARWTRSLGATSSFQIQGYYDDFRRRFLLVEDSLETFDVEAQYNGSFGVHELVGGVGVRTTRDEFINNLNAFVLDPESRRLWIANAFLQDRIALTPEFDVIAGLKLERSTFTGVQLLPNLRLAWRPNARTLLWSAVSRAVRTPSRIDRQLVALPLLAAASGFESEKLIAFEAGYRGQPTATTTLSVSAFFNLYDDIRTTEFVGNPLPIQLRNSLKGKTYGLEAWGTQQLAPWWRASLGLAALGKDFRLKHGAIDLADRNSLGTDPEYQVLARSRVDLAERVQLDVGARAVGDLRRADVGDYIEADARLSWRATEMLELFVAGTNLLHRTHAESDDPGRAQLIERSLYAGSRIRF